MFQDPAVIIGLIYFAFEAGASDGQTVDVGSTPFPQQMQCWICANYTSNAVDALTGGFYRMYVPQCQEYKDSDSSKNEISYGMLLEVQNSGEHWCIVFQEINSGGNVAIRGIADDFTLETNFGLKFTESGCVEDMIFPKISTTKNFRVCACQYWLCNSGKLVNSAGNPVIGFGFLLGIVTILQQLGTGS